MSASKCCYHRQCYIFSKDLLKDRHIAIDVKKIPEQNSSEILGSQGVKSCQESDRREGNRPEPEQDEKNI